MKFRSDSQFSRVWVLGICLLGSTMAFSHPEHHDDLIRAEKNRDVSRIRDVEAVRPYDVKGYALKARFDWEHLKLSALVEIRLQTDLSKVKEIELDSRVSRIVSVQAENRNLPFLTEKGLLKLDISSLTVGNRDIRIMIRYEVAANAEGAFDAFRAVPHRRGDPIQSRVVSTISEPLGAPEWMPCNDVTTDRATFSTEFVMEESETFIANGDLQINRLEADNTRRMSYETKYSLPTYLMAFAQGEFGQVSVQYRNIPISLWFRRGLRGDFEGMLKELTRQMEVFERLLTPYPFEKYALVLLPEFSGGIEHAGITFQGEISSTQARLSRDMGLSAHELAHQWFGDYVTIESWDDLWIKEGMATLLAEEASRPFEDQNKYGRLFGRNFGVEAGDAIRDPKLIPGDKYTSGPYGRAAWLLTQIRSLVGEERFWFRIREVLRAHAFSSVGSNEFLNYFSPELKAERLTMARRALHAKLLPQLVLSKMVNDQVVLALKDPEGALVAPVELKSVNTAGGSATSVLNVGSKRTIELSKDKLWVLDPLDRHPIDLFKDSENSLGKVLLPRLIPNLDGLITKWLEEGANSQILALGSFSSWNLSPQKWAEVLTRSASEEAKFMKFQLACELGAKATGTLKALWASVIEEHLLYPPTLGFSERVETRGLSHCRGVISDTFWAREWKKLIQNPSAPEWDELATNYLAQFSLPVSELAVGWGGLAREGVTVRSRLVGITALTRHLKGVGNFEKPTELGRWKEVVSSLLQTTEVGEILQRLFDLTPFLKDKALLAPVAAGVRSAIRPYVRGVGICRAYEIARDDKGAWTSFIENLGDTSKWHLQVRKIIADPKECQTFL